MQSWPVGAFDAHRGIDGKAAAMLPAAHLVSVIVLDQTPPDESAVDGWRGEIWAYGLRNPWRYAFDAAVNYGWNITEGSLCYPGDPCAKQGLSLPVLEHAHDASSACSITGGQVYRGSAIPELRGRNFYSDLCDGWLRSFVCRNGVAAEQTDWNIASVGQIFSFGEDALGELYMLTANGAAYKIVRP